MPWIPWRRWGQGWPESGETCGVALLVFLSCIQRSESSANYWCWQGVVSSWLRGKGDWVWLSRFKSAWVQRAALHIIFPGWRISASERSPKQPCYGTFMVRYLVKGHIRCQVKATCIIITSSLLNRMEHPLSTCTCCATPSAYVDLCQLSTSMRKRTPSLRWSLTTKNSTNSCAISVNCTQVSKNGRHFPQFCCLHHTICQGDDDTNIEFSSQHDISAAWKLSEKIDPERVNCG